MEEKTEYKYDAFISYRHLPADQAIAESLQKEMERFQVPKNISPKLPLKHRVFRDRVELSTGDLSESIRKGLEQFRYLIVVCSKRTKLSPWCLKEIALFRKLHGDERIIAVLTEGEPSESFPPALLELKTAGLDAQGNPQKVTREILAADVRPSDFIQSHRRQVLSYEALEADPLRHRKYLKEALALLRKREIYRIIAGMLDLSLGDLKQRDRERRLRRLAIASSAIGLSLFLFSIAILSMYFQANADKKETRQQNSLMMLENADRKLEEGGRTNAILIADEALAGSEKDMNRYSLIRSRYYSILNRALSFEIYTPLHQLSLGGLTSFYAVDEANHYLYSGSSGNGIRQWNILNGALEKGIDLPYPVLSLAFQGETLSMSDGRGKLHALVPSTGKEQNILSQQDTQYTQIGAIPHSSLLIAIREDGGFDLVDPLQNTVIHKETVTTPILYLTTSSSGKEIAFVDQKGLVKVLDVTQLSVKYQFTMKGAFLSAKSLAFSGDGSFLVASSNQKWYTIDLAHQSRKEQDRPYGNGSLLLYEDLIYLPVSTTRGWNFERINIKTLQKKDTWKSKGLVISDMAVNPKNGDLLVAWTDHQVSLITAQEEKKIVSSKETVSSLSFLKDGSYALMSSIDGKMQVIRYQPLREEQKIEGVPLAQSPDLSMLLLEPERTENAKRFNALYHQTLSRLLHTEETRTPEQLWNDLSTLKKESSLEQSLHRGVKERILLSQQDLVPGKKTQGIPAAPAESGPGGDPPTD